MNNFAIKKVEELTDKAKWYTDSEGETYRTTFKFEERFAELIIKECCEVLTSYDHRPADILRTQFGIEK